MRRPLYWCSRCFSEARTPTCGKPRTEIERLAAVPTDPGFVLNEIQLLRMRAHAGRRPTATTPRYRDFADRYRDMAKSLGFEGHMAIAETMR